MSTLDFLKIKRLKKPTQEYLDIIISGRSLKNLLNADDRDMVTPFGWCEPDVEDEMIKEFKGEKNSQAAPGRIMIYVCPGCLDIGCGSITVELELTENSVIWKNFGYENGYEEIDFESFKNIGPLKFDRNEYMTKLSTFVKRNFHYQYRN